MTINFVTEKGAHVSAEIEISASVYGTGITASSVLVNGAPAKMHGFRSNVKWGVHGLVVDKVGSTPVMALIPADISAKISAAARDALDAAQRAAAEAEAARQRKINAIPGLKEIKSAYADIASWEREFSRSFDGENACGGLGVRPHPAHDIPAMLARFPAAAAYIKAETYSLGANSELRIIGERALDAIIDAPERYAEALERMEQERAAFLAQHIWD